MTYVRVIPNTVALLFQYLVFLYSIFSFSQAFSSLLCVCVALCLNLTLSTNRGTFFFQTMLSCLEPFRLRGMDNTVQGTLWFSAVMLSLFWIKFHVQIACNGNELGPYISCCFHLWNIKGVSSCIIKMLSGLINKKIFKSPW